MDKLTRKQLASMADTHITWYMGDTEVYNLKLQGDEFRLWYEKKLHTVMIERRVCTSMALGTYLWKITEKYQALE